MAVTRAKSKLIVIGNPLILYKDEEKWGAFIDQAKMLGTLCGAPFPTRCSSEREEIRRRINLPRLDENNTAES